MSLKYPEFSYFDLIAIYFQCYYMILLHVDDACEQNAQKERNIWQYCDWKYI